MGQFRQPQNDENESKQPQQLQQRPDSDDENDVDAEQQTLLNMTPWTTTTHDMTAISNPMLQLQQSSHLPHQIEEKKDEEEEDENDDNDEPRREEIKENEDESESEVSWQYKHCRWLACAVNFGPSNLRKIRPTGIHILTQP